MQPTRYISVIIAYKNHALVTEVLTQLSVQSTPPHEVIVFDNGGTLTDEFISSQPLADLTRLVSRADNPGYGAAVNVARDTECEAVLVLTHDAQFAPDLAEQLLAPMDDHSRVGATAPLLRRVSDPNAIFSAGGTLSGGGKAGHLVTPRRATPYQVAWADGAIVMFRSEALNKIGWLAEEYFLYFEDVDTGWRLTESGYRTMIVPAAQGAQEPGAHPMRLGIRNMTLFARKARVPFAKHFLAVTGRVAEESAAAILRGSFPPLLQAARGWIDGWRGKTGHP